MTDTPLTRAARALMKRRSGGDDFERLDDQAQAEFLGDARAVLEAVREPSAEIVAAGASEHDTGDGQLHFRKWQAMIDAALRK